MERITLLDTSVGSTNKGDEIIMRCCKEELFGGEFERYFLLSAPTHLRAISALEGFGHLPDSASEIARSKYKFVCGTNILQSNMFHRSNQWDISLLTYKPFQNAILVGVGGNINLPSGIQGVYTKALYKKLLSREYIHSVRTKSTAESLKKLGFKAIDTGCITLWKLVPEFCAMIPRKKADCAVITLTDYNRNQEADKILVEIVKKNYHKVFFWPQGIYDDEYLKQIGCSDEIEILPASVDAYEKLLNKEKNLDYIGTRFHGGIFAMRHGVRCIMVTLDERMTAMQRCVWNNCIPRDALSEELDNKINSTFETVVDIDFEAVSEWKAQFVGRE